ncbi:hypothetical protein HC928_09725 [bacterium]|nr:hypothetical protein [bacterium]
MTTTNTNKTKTWAVVNRKTGKIAWTRSSNHHKQALFASRDAARAALKTGEVYADPSQGVVRAFFVDGKISSENA